MALAAVALHGVAQRAALTTLGVGTPGNSAYSHDTTAGAPSNWLHRDVATWRALALGTSAAADRARNLAIANAPQMSGFAALHDHPITVQRPGGAVYHPNNIPRDNNGRYSDPRINGTVPRVDGAFINVGAAHLYRPSVRVFVTRDADIVVRCLNSGPRMRSKRGLFAIECQMATLSAGRSTTTWKSARMLT